MATRIFNRTINRLGGYSQTSSHSQTQSSSRSSSRSATHSSSESQSRSRHSTTTEPTVTTTINRGESIRTETVTGYTEVDTHFEDVAIGVRISVPIEKGSLWFPGQPPP